MKKLLICTGLLVFTATIAIGQKTKAKPAVKTTKATVPSKSLMKNLNDSFSYAAGMNIATNMRDQGITNINAELMAKAVNDVFKDKTKALTPEAANACLQSQMNIYGEQKNAENVKKNAAEVAKSRAFLEENRKRPGVVTLPSGVQFEVIKPGDSVGVKATINDSVVVNYSGRLIDGTEFDNSAKGGGAVPYPVGIYIKGWAEVLQLMPRGAHWKVYIPAELAYGDRGTGGGLIPPGAALIFDMILEEIRPVATK